MKLTNFRSGAFLFIGALTALQFIGASLGWNNVHAMPPAMNGNMMGCEKPWMDGGGWRDEDMRGHMGGMGGRMPAIEPTSLPEPASRGAKLMDKYCGQCHNLPSPAMHSREDWPTVLDRMFRRLDMMSRWASRWMSVKAPSEAEKAVLSNYIVSHAMRPFDAKSISGDPAGAQTFRETCGACHALPDTRQHTARNWPAVVARMRNNMQAMQKPVPDAVRLDLITRFLQENAQPLHSRGTGR